MRAEYNELYDTREKLFEANRAQVDICGEAKRVLADFSALTDFQGEGAQNLKSYFGEVHQEVNAALSAILSDFDERFRLMNEEFRSNVDSGYTPVLDTDYLMGVVNKLVNFKADFDIIDQKINAQLLSVSDICALDPVGGCVVDAQYEQCIFIVNETIERLYHFDEAHAEDMASIDDAIGAVLGVIRESRLCCADASCHYNTGDLLNFKSYAGLKQAQFNFGTSVSELPGESDTDEVALAMLLGLMCSVFRTGAVSAPSGGQGEPETQATAKRNKYMSLCRSGIAYRLAVSNGNMFYHLTSNLTKSQLETRLSGLNPTDGHPCGGGQPIISKKGSILCKKSWMNNPTILGEMRVVTPA